MSTFEPGTVAVVNIDGEEFRAIRTGTPTNMGWEVVRPSSRYWVSDHSEFGRVTGVYPLAVIDLGDYDNRAVTYLRNIARDDRAHDGKPTPRAKLVNLIADQIEAQTRTPRIPEPGLWGVVEADWSNKDNGELHPSISRGEFVRTPRGWSFTGDGYAVAWSELIDPTLVREGVTA